MNFGRIGRESASSRVVNHTINQLFIHRGATGRDRVRAERNVTRGSVFSARYAIGSSRSWFTQDRRAQTLSHGTGKYA